MKAIKPLSFMIASIFLLTACGYNKAPTNVRLMEASANDSGDVTAKWQQAKDDNTSAEKLVYQLHASTDKNFTPSEKTLIHSENNITSVKILNKLKGGETYYLRLVVIDKGNKRTISNAMPVQVPIKPKNPKDDSKKDDSKKDDSKKDDSKKDDSKKDDSKKDDSKKDTEPPTNVKLLSLKSFKKGEFVAEWTEAKDNVTASKNIRYELHASTEKIYKPTADTIVYSGKGKTKVTVKNLKPGELYQTYFFAYDESGNRTRSDNAKTGGLDNGRIEISSYERPKVVIENTKENRNVNDKIKIKLVEGDLKYIKAITWDYGDGKKERISISDVDNLRENFHRYQKAGTYTITLDVYSWVNFGMLTKLDTLKQIITIGQYQSPKIAIKNKDKLKVFDIVRVDLLGKKLDGINKIVWNYGDGSQAIEVVRDKKGLVTKQDYRYKKVGKYTITADIYDKENVKLGTAKQNISVVQHTPMDNSKSKILATGITKCNDYVEDIPPNHFYGAGLDCSLNYSRDGHPIPAGQDGHLQTGVKMSYTTFKYNNETCIKDNVTGLVWEKKTNDGGLQDYKNSYTWYDPNPKTNGGKIGKQNGGECTGSKCDTQAYIQALNNANYCGYSDWRMPNIEELNSIVDYGRYEVDPIIQPTINPIFGDTYSRIKTGFNQWKEGEYLSSTTFTRKKDKVWCIGFMLGEVQTCPKTYNAQRIRAVRSNNPVVENKVCNKDNADSRFEIITGGSEIKDKRTGLIWQRCSLGQTWDGNTCAGTAKKYKWPQALAKSQALGNGYRLPNIRELNSLIDRDCHAYAINEKIFPNIPVSDEGISNDIWSHVDFWSSSPEEPGFRGARIVDFYYGKTGSQGESAEIYVRPVRSQ